MGQLEGAATEEAAKRARAQEGGARLSRSDFWPTPPAEDGFGLPMLSAMRGQCVSVSVCQCVNVLVCQCVLAC